VIRHSWNVIWYKFNCIRIRSLTNDRKFFTWFTSLALTFAGYHVFYVLGGKSSRIRQICTNENVIGRCEQNRPRNIVDPLKCWQFGANSRKVDRSWFRDIKTSYNNRYAFDTRARAVALLEKLFPHLTANDTKCYEVKGVASFTPFPVACLSIVARSSRRRMCRSNVQWKLRKTRFWDERTSDRKSGTMARPAVGLCYVELE